VVPSALDDGVVAVDLNRPMSEIRAELSRYPVRTRLSLTGPLVVARDIAHAKIAERLAAGEPMPAYLRAQDCIRHVEVLEYPELGMEAIWKIDVVDFPAFIVVDDKATTSSPRPASRC
jgi:tartrate dehydratase beta subunit/fumarate hydratase class I family protein